MMMMMIMMIAIIVIIMETPKIAQHVPERVRVFGCVEAGQPTIAADSNSGQKHVAFKTKFLQSASVQYLEQPVIICPISFNLTLQQDNYDPHPTREPFSPLV